MHAPLPAYLRPTYVRAKDFGERGHEAVMFTGSGDDGRCVGPALRAIESSGFRDVKLGGADALACPDGEARATSSRRIRAASASNPLRHFAANTI
jgi:hypothetical protein